MNSYWNGQMRKKEEEDNMEDFLLEPGEIEVIVKETQRHLKNYLKSDNSIY